MKRRYVFPALAGAAAVGGRAETVAFALQFRDSFVKHWLVERDYTLAVAKAMPAEHYGFKPNPVQRSFGEQLTHLAAANIAYFSAFDLMKPPERVQSSDKEVTQKALNASWDYSLAVLHKLTEKDMMRSDLGRPRFPAHTATDLCLRAYTHTAHHRGQAIVYLRVKDIAPPTWAFEPTAK